MCVKMQSASLCIWLCLLGSFCSTLSIKKYLVGDRNILKHLNALQSKQLPCLEGMSASVTGFRWRLTRHFLLQVGDAMHRGVSGGQKKRVTTGEQIWNILSLHSGVNNEVICTAILHFHLREIASEISASSKLIFWILPIMTWKISFLLILDNRMMKILGGLGYLDFLIEMVKYHPSAYHRKLCSMTLNWGCFLQVKWLWDLSAFFSW